MSMKWDLRYLDMAKLVSTWSKDPSTKTGAVIVSPDNFVVGVGYNGFPRGVEDSSDRLNDRETKYKLMVHCERNAIISARRDLFGCTLYTWPFMSCAPCAGMVVQAGIKRCVAPVNDTERWVADFKISQAVFAETGIVLDLINLEDCWWNQWSNSNQERSVRRKHSVSTSSQRKACGAWPSVTRWGPKSTESGTGRRD